MFYVKSWKEDEQPIGGTGSVDYSPDFKFEEEAIAWAEEMQEKGYKTKIIEFGSSD